MSPRPYPLRYVICRVCHRHCVSERKDRDICRDCYRNEPRLRCVRCGKMRHAVEEATGLCPRCASRLEAMCSCCSKQKVIYNQEVQLCKACNLAARKRDQTKVRRIKRPCSTCGEIRSSALMHRSICRACWMLESKGQQICSRCQKSKVIHFEHKQLCKQCYKDYGAKKALQRYLTTYTTPYPYNKELFDLLVTTINREMVTQRTNQRFRAFGQFLQAHELQAPLTWERIEEALPPLGMTHRNQPKYIRACLLDVGHLLVAVGKVEKRETYVARRNALSPLKNAPEHIQLVLHRYVAWHWEQRSSPSGVRQHLETLASFWSWCNRHEIRSVHEVHPALMNEYLLTLYWQWQCTQCQAIVSFEPTDRQAPQVCRSCSTLGSFTQIPRYTQNTVRGHRATLWTFFKWAKVNKMIMANPVQRRIAPPEPKIQHYAPEIIRQLCMYILYPNAKPVEALILYLIIFHGLSVWELQHAEIPTLRLDFASSAESWLKPLLERFEAQRCLVAQNPRNRYVFVSPGGTRRRNPPVGKVFIWTLVRRASLQILGVACNPNTLRKTAGVIFADAAGGAILRWMGWQASQAFAYTWVSREMIHPKNPDNSEQTVSLLNEGTIVFPPPREGET